MAIGVRVPSDPSWVHDTVLEAMEIWNHAQEWFVQKYYPKENHTYILKASTSGQIIVVFENKTNSEYIGLTNYVHIGGRIVRATITLAVIESSQALDCTLNLALHEFGHGLGLGGANSNNTSNDLMWDKSATSCDFQTPSTLDLFAIHVLAAGGTPRSVTLPSNIPYEVVPESAVPEFSYEPVVLLMVTVFVSLLVLRRRGRQRSQLSRRPLD